MTVWETEDEYATAAQASLPTPNDTPYRTPSRTSRASRKKSRSPVLSSSPPGYRNGDHGKRNSKDLANDDTISILDPRRFTPTLHANLVSEILTLRRDQEEKIRLIDNLESSLHNSRNETEELLQSLSTTGKEIRSQKRQLALLEGGTSSALGELARERDEAIEAAQETKKRLDVALKKSRAQEDEAERTHDLWGRDKDTWEDERRKLDRRVHVAESRLKTVLEEVAAYQALHQLSQMNGEGYQNDGNPVGQNGDAGSIRTMSPASSIRFSMLSGPNGYGGVNMNGVSLADELNLETEDEETNTDNDGRESAMSMMHKRNQSKDSFMFRNHTRNQSIDSLRRPGSVLRGRLLANQAALERLTRGIVEADETPDAEKPVYVDSGVQFSPPPSPYLKAVLLNVIELEPIPEPIAKEKPARVQATNDMEVEANQARKRISINKPLPIDPPSQMVSSSSQTTRDEPLSPPRTPKSPSRPPPPPPSELSTQLPAVAMISIPPSPSAPTRDAPTPPPIYIPSISVIPPTSRPSTPRTPLLPQHSRDASCQAWFPASVSTASVAVQTEGIRVDERIVRLPKHLQPSNISSAPPSPELPATDGSHLSQIPGETPPPRNPRRIKSQQSLIDSPSSPSELAARVPYDAYPGNNDDGPLSKDTATLRRPHRISSLFAGFDGQSSDEADDFAGDDLSDNDNGYRTALSAPRPKASMGKLSKRAAPTSVPENSDPLVDLKHRLDKSKKMDGNFDSNGTLTLEDHSLLLSRRTSAKGATRSSIEKLNLAKQGTMRRATLIQNGIAAHNGRARSPSEPELIQEPPFPIPTRASSRAVPFSSSAPSDGNRSPTPRGGNPWHRRGSRHQVRSNSIRKIRSAAHLPGQRPRRQGSRSPPPFSPSTEAPESPQLPPMPRNNITSPYADNQASRNYAVHRQQLSTNTAGSSNTGAQSVGSSVQATSVVDSIAQTMVGEWMFKYVRRRKSFGVSDNNAIDGDAGVNGVRHKRWVWLAPYERAVMWSSKQPTSGSALMGKSGRKLAIQSVLDVKDDNPPPKGSTNVFNRSILILTPARALKFTATTRERHYTWLTALSFLAHSSQAVPEMISAPPPIQQYQQTIPTFEIPIPAKSKLRMGPSIRDSIRVAKNKAPSFPTLTNRSLPDSRRGGTASTRTDDSHAFSSSTRGDQNGSGSTAGTSNSNTTFWRDAAPQAAAPPTVPRFHEREQISLHGRKRSNTGPRIPPPLSFRGFSDRPVAPRGPQTAERDQYSAPNPGHGPQHSTAGMSVGTNGSSDVYQQSLWSQRSSSYAWTNGGGPLSINGGSVRTSDASARPGGVVNNFFDAVGTVRMEAFISPLAGIPGDDEDFYEPQDDWFSEAGNSKRRSRESSNTGFGAFAVGGRRRSRDRTAYAGARRRSRNRESFGRGIAKDDWYGGSKTAGEEDYGYRGRERNDDPFRGF